MKHRNDNLLFAIAFADAAAVATEYVDKRQYAELFEAALRLDGFYAHHPRHRETIPGKYGDDGQMSIAVAEVVMDPSWVRNGLPTPLQFADAFTRTFHRDPRPGYARSFYEFLQRTRTGHDFLQKIRPTSEKNGAMMRTLPVGVLHHPGEVMNVAAVQAALTHNTAIGIRTAQAGALMSHFALYRNESFDQLPDYLEVYLGKDLGIGIDIRKPWRGEVHQPASNTLHAVVELLRSSETVSEVLRGAIRLGGDTDTVAAIAVGIASSRMPFDISDAMIAQFEPFGSYGETFLKYLGKRLMNTFDTTTE